MVLTRRRGRCSVTVLDGQSLMCLARTFILPDPNSVSNCVPPSLHYPATVYRMVEKIKTTESGTNRRAPRKGAGGLAEVGGGDPAGLPGRGRGGGRRRGLSEHPPLRREVIRRGRRGGGDTINACSFTGGRVSSG